VLWSLQQMRKCAYWALANSFLTTAGSVVALQSGYGLRGVFIAMAAANVVYAAGLCRVLRRQGIAILFGFDRPLAGASSAALSPSASSRSCA